MLSVEQHSTLVREKSLEVSLNPPLTTIVTSGAAPIFILTPLYIGHKLNPLPTEKRPDTYIRYASVVSWSGGLTSAQASF